MASHAFSESSLTVKTNMRTGPAVENDLRALEMRKERVSVSEKSEIIFRRRALTVRHALHVLPGETVLEIGAGRGAWASELAKVVGPEISVTGLVLNEGLLDTARGRELPNLSLTHAKSLEDLPSGSWDYVVAAGMIGAPSAPEFLNHVGRLLKPGGQCLFFEENSRRMRGPSEAEIHRLFAPHRGSGETGKADQQNGSPEAPLFQDLAVYRIVSESCVPGRPSAWFAGLLESIPSVARLGRAYLVAARTTGPADEIKRIPLSKHRHLFGSTSVVIPCRNEAPNLPRLVQQLLAFYGDYIYEVIIVDDNSTDATAEVAEQLRAADPRVKLINRRPPGGVGRALRDGYALAGGKFILSMDADFIELLPELRDMYDEIASGKDGAIGSRFTPGSLLVNYPAPKMLCNRALHFILRVALRRGIRDLSNNLKLFRADILKHIQIEADDFAANLETGLKPLLRGYNIAQVPISWINRSAEMGSSSFKLLAVGPNYVKVMARAIWRGGA